MCCGRFANIAWQCVETPKLVRTHTGHISSMPPPYQYLWLGRIWRQVWIWKSNESTYFAEVLGVRVRAGESFAPLGRFYQTHLREPRSAQGGRCDAFDLCIPAQCQWKRWRHVKHWQFQSSTWGRCDNSQAGWYLCATRPGCVFLGLMVEARLVAMDLTIRQDHS